jgi:hypothetical protein
MRIQTSSTEKRWLTAACLMIVALPVVRLIEAVLRSVYMSEHYGSFWQGLTKDLWFSEGWIIYVQTPLGLAMTMLPIILICSAVGCFSLAIRTTSVQANARAEQNGGGQAATRSESV